MCNACGFQCCASDMFGGCGCDHCDNPECWAACEECGEYEEDCLCEDFDEDNETAAWTGSTRCAGCGRLAGECDCEVLFDDGGDV